MNAPTMIPTTMEVAAVRPMDRRSSVDMESVRGRAILSRVARRGSFALATDWLFARNCCDARRIAGNKGAGCSPARSNVTQGRHRLSRSNCSQADREIHSNQKTPVFMRSKRATRVATRYVAPIDICLRSCSSAVTSTATGPRPKVIYLSNPIRLTIHESRLPSGRLRSSKEAHGNRGKKSGARSFIVFCCISFRRAAGHA